MVLSPPPSPSAMPVRSVPYQQQLGGAPAGSWLAASNDGLTSAWVAPAFGGVPPSDPGIGFPPPPLSPDAALPPDVYPPTDRVPAPGSLRLLGLAAALALAERSTRRLLHRLLLAIRPVAAVLVGFR